MAGAPRYEIGGVFLLKMLESGSKLCSFSGDKVKTTEAVSGMNYPFLSSLSGELNFASFLNTKPCISQKWAFLSTFAFQKLYYTLQEDDANYFVLHDSTSLENLERFYNEIVVSAENLKNPTYCNFDNEIIGTRYESESLFSFLYSVFKQFKDGFDFDNHYTKSVYVLGHDGNIFKDVKNYARLSEFFKLLKSLSEAGQLQNFIQFVSRFTEKKGDKYDSTWRNRLCADLLAFRSLNKIIERFIGTVRMRDGGSIYGLPNILHIYHQTTQFDMDAELVKKCKNVGSLIGEYSRSTEDKGLLFSIRNSRTRADFLKILSHAQFKMVDEKRFPEDQKSWISKHFSDEFFVRMPDDHKWEEYKALVSIFAMNRFLTSSKVVNQPGNDSNSATN